MHSTDPRQQRASMWQLANDIRNGEVEVLPPSCRAPLRLSPASRTFIHDAIREKLDREADVLRKGRDERTLGERIRNVENG